MLEAGLWAALGQSALIVGALLVARFRKLTEPRWLGLVMAFGAGALISAITTDLVVEAYHEAGRGATGLGLLIGAVGYYVLTEWLDRRAEREDPEEPVEEAAVDRTRKRSPPPPTRARLATSPSGWCSTAFPSRWRSGSRCSVAATCRWRSSARCSCRTFPRRSAWPRRSWPGSIPLSRVLLRFAAIVAVGAIAAAVGYGVLNETDADAIAIIQSIAAGAMIVVVVNEMIPIAVRGAKRHAGLAAAAGFAVAAFLATLNS